ncbi:MAG: 5-nucleotidase, partial [Mucilaginibacter sp.]|nr:5-nucleotidase [Mucilaginibacter sp.]
LKDIQENCSHFIEPFICSSPEVEYEALLCHTEKAAWIEHYAGAWWTKRLILTKDKTVVRGHFLIDDKPTITGAMAPTWGHLVFDQPYNRDVIGNGRFTWTDWPKLKALLLQLTEQNRIKLRPETQSIIIAQPEDVCRLQIAS